MSSWAEKLKRRKKLKSIRDDRKKLSSLSGYRKKLIDNEQPLKFVFFDSKYILFGLLALYAYQWNNYILPAIRAQNDLEIVLWVMCFKVPLLIFAALLKSGSDYLDLLSLDTRKRLLNYNRTKNE